MTKTVDDILAEHEKKHGLRIGAPAPVNGLTTGNIGVDWATGVGGLPIGRITELYGLESSGKTTLALQTAVQLQRSIKAKQSDERIVYLDFEHALDTTYASELGVDFNHPSFVTLQPSNLEQGAKVALELIDTGKVRLVVFDSVAAMAPQRHKDGDFDQATIQMHRAKLISALCATLIEPLDVQQCAAVFINHKMESVDMSGRPGLPPKVTTPGGRGLKYYASLRLEFDVAGGVREKLENFLTREEGNQLVGNKVLVKCVKNKVGIPGQVVEVRNRFGLGFDNAWSAIQILLARKLIANGGAWFYFDKDPRLAHPEMTTGATGRPSIHGAGNVQAFADEHPDWTEQLISVATAAIAGDLQ